MNFEVLAEEGPITLFRVLCRKCDSSFPIMVHENNTIFDVLYNNEIMSELHRCEDVPSN